MLPEKVKLSEVKHPEEVKLPQEEEEVKLPQEEEEEAKHPEEVNPCLHVSESQLACWGLGRGIKATEPKRLMQVVARPVPLNETTANGGSEPCVEETRVGTGFSEMTFLVSSKAELTRKLSSSLKAPLSKVVAFEFGCSYEKSMVNCQTFMAVGERIRNRTYAFRLQPHDSLNAEEKAVRLTFVEDCKRKEYNCILKERDKEMPNEKEGRDVELPKLTSSTDDRITACWRAIERRLGGVTHFVASIDMGGKIYREVTISSSTSTTVKDASFSTTIEMFKVASELGKAQKNSKTTYTKRTRVLLHAEVMKNLSKKAVGARSDDRTQGGSRRVFARLAHPFWAKSMRIASQNFIDDELQRTPMRQPFYLKAGKSYVTADAAGKLGTTGEKEKATPVYIETLPQRWCFPWQGEIDFLTTPGGLFLLAFEIDDQRFYLCTSKDKY